MMIVALLVFLLSADRIVAQPTPAATAANTGLAERFRLADRNGDGSLSATEAKQGGWFVDQSERFETLDNDHNGTVTLFELTESLSLKVKEWLGADSDGDGRVTESEAQKSSSSLVDVFKRADADGDRVVTRDEYESFSQRGYYDNVDLPSVVPNIIEKRF